MADIVERPRLESDVAMFEKRLREMQSANQDTPLFKNVDCVLVGDLRDMIAVIREQAAKIVRLRSALRQAEAGRETETLLAEALDLAVTDLTYLAALLKGRYTPNPKVTAALALHRKEKG